MQYHQRYGQTPCHPAGESRNPHLRVDFDRRVKLEFHGSKVTSDAGLLAYRELDAALGLTEIAGGLFQDSRTGKNGRHGMIGQFRQSVFGRLGGYDDVNGADRLGRDPAMRWIVGGHAVTKQAGHMDASNLIKALQNTLQAGGRPHMGNVGLVNG